MSGIWTLESLRPSEHSPPCEATGAGMAGLLSENGSESEDVMVLMAVQQLS